MHDAPSESKAQSRDVLSVWRSRRCPPPRFHGLIARRRGLVRHDPNVGRAKPVQGGGPAATLEKSCDQLDDRMISSMRAFQRRRSRSSVRTGFTVIKLVNRTSSGPTRSLCGCHLGITIDARAVDGQLPGGIISSNHGRSRSLGRSPPRVRSGDLSAQPCMASHGLRVTVEPRAGDRVAGRPA